MNANLNRRTLAWQSVVTMLLLVGVTAAAQADIYQWEYVDPVDPSQGKQQSTTLAPDGAGIDAVPDANLAGLDLSLAYLVGADLSSVYGVGVNLTDANLANANFGDANLSQAVFRQANLTNARFFVYGGSWLLTCCGNGTVYSASIIGADFTDADVRGASFRNDYFGKGISLEQLYSTASYQDHDLSGIDLVGNDLAGGNFAGQNLVNAALGGNLAGANFHSADLTGATVSGDLTDADFTAAEVRGATIDGITLSQLYSTVNYQAGDLSQLSFFGDLSGGNFAGLDLANANIGGDLTGASFRHANLKDAGVEGALTGADFGGADVRGARLSQIELAQLYSTASYQSRDLTGIALSGDLSGANFVGQNLTSASFRFFTILTGADFRESNLANAVFVSHVPNFPLCFSGTICSFAPVYVSLTDVDLTAADTRGADLRAEGANTFNMVWPNGHIDGLDLDAGKRLVVRDYDGEPTPIPITVDQHLAIGPEGTLRMVFEVDDWGSTISFARGIPVALGGKLELTFADDVELAGQVGRSFHVFDWTGVSPTGEFTVSSPYRWDISRLYTTGEVTLTAVPEPGSLFLLGFATAVCMADFRVRQSSGPNYGDTTC